MDLNARLIRGSNGHVLQLHAKGVKGYVTIDADLEDNDDGVPPAVCGLIADRAGNGTVAMELRTPQEFDAFLARALTFLSSPAPTAEEG